MHSDEEIISGIRNNQDWAIASIYKTQHTSIKKMVYYYRKIFRNTLLEPEDILQEDLTRLILNIRKGKFKGDSSIATYLNGICRNICLKILSKTYPEVQTQNFASQRNFLSQNNPDLTEPENDNYYELLAFISKLKKQMGDGCREIIDLRFKQVEEISPTMEPDHKLLGFDEIAQRLNITVDNARQRFKRCMDQLRNMVFAHPEYQTLFD